MRFRLRRGTRSSRRDDWEWYTWLEFGRARLRPSLRLRLGRSLALPETAKLYLYPTIDRPTVPIRLNGGGNVAVTPYDSRAEYLDPDRGSLLGAVGRACASAFSGRRSFRRQLSDYLAGGPAIRLGAMTKYVRVDSIRAARGLLWDSYQIGYFLADEPVTNPDLDTLLAKRLTLRSSEDALRKGVQFVGGFDSVNGFERARQRFEHDAAVWFHSRLNQPEPRPAEPAPAGVGPSPLLAAAPPPER
jgi:hypothetical protein